MGWSCCYGLLSDGTVIGGVLDRNGLRPARYYVTTDDRVIMASEVGVVNENAENIRAKGRFGTRQMLSYRYGRTTYHFR